LVRNYLSSFQGVHSSNDLARFDAAPGFELYKTIFKPLLDERDYLGRPVITKDDKLIIIPDDVLRLLPFEALPTSVPARQEMPTGRHGPVPLHTGFLADEFDIAYQYSATALILQRTIQRPSAMSGILILADPIFSSADSRSREFRQPNSSMKNDFGMQSMGLAGLRRTPGTKILGDDSAAIPRLDKTGVMARQLLADVFSGGGGELLEGARATKQQLLTSDIESMRFIVLATHGVVAGDIPGINEPALLFTQYGAATQADKILMRSDVMKMHLNAEVVALTACKTGLGDEVLGEGVLSLGRSFQSVGAHAVLLSMWEVAEDSTNDLVISFFSHLSGGETKRDALRHARQELRRAGYAHPYYWAPFGLMTD
jgi:CHAT domain-containing protein